MDNPMPGAVIAVQTFGDFLNFNPHLHIISTDGSFMAAVMPDANHLEPLLRLEVLKMLKREGKITEAVIENMDTWHHSGFHVYCGDVIRSDDEKGLERLALYVIRAPISQERMVYIAATEGAWGIGQVVYTGKNSKTRERFTALDWLARLVTHIPNKGEQLVRYYGYYSNKARSVRRKEEAIYAKIQNAEGQERGMPVPSLIENNVSGKAFRRNWARLIQKVYHSDPLVCPKCNGNMKIIAFIEEETVIRKILKHLNLWITGNHGPPPLSKAAGEDEFPCVPAMDITDSFNNHHTQSQMPYEDEYSQLTTYEDHTY